MTLATIPDPRASAEAFTAHEERGWWPGGPTDPHPTQNGVTQETYTHWRALHGLPDRSVHLMTAVEQAAIYDSYWAACEAAEVARYSAALALCHFDCAFNAGAPRAAKILQMTVDAAQDGDLGPLTWVALQRAVAITERGTVMACLQNRWDFLRTLSNFAAWEDVWRGRENRLALVCGVPWSVT